MRADPAGFSKSSGRSSYIFILHNSYFVERMIAGRFYGIAPHPVEPTREFTRRGCGPRNLITRPNLAPIRTGMARR
jgi:hypothetical protein